MSKLHATARRPPEPEMFYHGLVNGVLISIPLLFGIYQGSALVLSRFIGY